MSFFSTLKTALSLKEKLAATGVLVLICALVGAGFAWERHQLKQAMEKIGSLDQAVKEPRQPGGCKLKTAPVRPVVAARPAE
ncbi:hypothetical protein ACJEMN_18075, partial [Escherichia coli]